MKSELPKQYIKDVLSNNSGFKNILKKIRLGVNEKGVISIFNLEGLELQEATLNKIFEISQSIVQFPIPYKDNLEILKEILYKFLTYSEAENLDNLIRQYIEEDNLEKSYKDNFLNGNFEKVIEILTNVKEEFLTTEEICKIIKKNTNLDLSVHDSRLPSFLKDLGYRKIRKRIAGEQLRLWIKDN